MKSQGQFCLRGVQRWEKSLQDTKNRNVFACREDLPKQIGPFERDIADVERVEHPGPVCVTQSEVIFGTGRFGVADISAVQVGEDVETAYDRKKARVELDDGHVRKTGMGLAMGVGIGRHTIHRIRALVSAETAV